MGWRAVFEGHRDVPHEGRGAPEDVAWRVVKDQTGQLSSVARKR